MHVLVSVQGQVSIHARFTVWMVIYQKLHASFGQLVVVGENITVQRENINHYGTPMGDKARV